MVNITSYGTKAGVRYRVRYRKPDGTQTDKRGFKRKKDAEAWAAEHVTTAKAQGTYIDPQAGRTHVGNLWPAWLAAKKTKSKPSYIESLERAWRVHVAPAWADREVASIGRREVQDWANIMSSDRSATVVLRAVGILRGIMDDAVAERMIASNPCERLSLPRKRPKQHVYLTADELFRLADQSGNDRTMILVLGLCGLRFGEFAGLHVGDVDFDARRLRIRRSATEVGHRIVVDTPKSGSTRSVVFPHILDGPLHDACDGRGDDEILFPDRNGGYRRRVHGPNDKSSSFYWAKRRAGITKPLTWHDLRHTAASLMVHAGANVKAVQNQLGHASAAMTLDVYADLFDDDLDGVGMALDRMLACLECGQNVGKNSEYTSKAIEGTLE